MNDEFWRMNAAGLFPGIFPVFVDFGFPEAVTVQ